MNKIVEQICDAKTVRKGKNILEVFCSRGQFNKLFSNMTFKTPILFICNYLHYAWFLMEGSSMNKRQPSDINKTYS